MSSTTDVARAGLPCHCGKRSESSLIPAARPDSVPTIGSPSCRVPVLRSCPRAGRHRASCSTGYSVNCPTNRPRLRPRPHAAAPVRHRSIRRRGAWACGPAPTRLSRGATVRPAAAVRQRCRPARAHPRARGRPQRSTTPPARPAASARRAPRPDAGSYTSPSPFGTVPGNTVSSCRAFNPYMRANSPPSTARYSFSTG